MWTQGSFTQEMDIGLDPARRYLITGALTGKSGGNYGQIYISTICIMHSIDQIVCGIEDEASPSSKHYESWHKQDHRGCDASDRQAERGWRTEPR